ncbi:DUF982 domain-containing protein [Mesorhizobium sp. WSM4904]|uniref:DUF982 domain-containing protein n=1 Tax=Mesorhizobium sp. WSM4904 TaxID=3038545 RepID=UPI0024187154|nr:DUF982 domain-containing protein [Mesorhizobium sp. WSM4904]WFP61635.1 DUF982 domain-containing protein [Mesorhizobium sp. WSM4904]
MSKPTVTSDMPLRAPVAIAVGAGFKREIASLAAMQNFLKEWPQAARGDCYVAAAQACEAAWTGERKLKEARQAFLCFAEKAGILWTGVDPVTALREAKIRRGKTRRAIAPRQRANQPRQ